MTELHDAISEAKQAGGIWSYKNTQVILRAVASGALVPATDAEALAGAVLAAALEICRGQSKHRAEQLLVPGTEREQTQRWIAGKMQADIIEDEIKALRPEAHAALARALQKAREEERQRCIEIAVRHWDWEPEDTIAMAAEMRVGMKSLADYEKRVAQMREDFPNGV